MSYARRDATSDVYVFSGDGGEIIDCCHCALGPDFRGTRAELLKHLGAHLQAGHKVPSYLFERLEREAEDDLICQRRVEFRCQAPEGAPGIMGIDMTGVRPCGGRINDGKCEFCDVTMIEETTR